MEGLRLAILIQKRATFCIFVGGGFNVGGKEGRN